MSNLKLLLPLALLALVASSASSSPLNPDGNSTTASPSPSTPQTSTTPSIPIGNHLNSTNNLNSTNADIPKPSYTRTMLKVSRSLPGETEELKVRTSEGSLATLIVKRRGDKSAPPPPPSATLNEASSSIWHTSRSASSDSWRPVGHPLWQPGGSSASSRGFQSPQTSENEADPLLRHYSSESRTSQQQQRTNVGANTYKLGRDSEHVPAEVVIRSQLNVKAQPALPGSESKEEFTRPQQRRQPSPLTIEDGVPVVHGKRVPDDPIDSKQIWRNARVINDQLVTESFELQQQPSAQLGVQVRQPAEQGGFDRFFEDVNRRYSKSSDSVGVGSEELGLSKPRHFHHDALAAEVFESGEEPYRPSIRKRMLQPDIAAVYPNSRLYSPSNTNQVPLVTETHSIKNNGLQQPQQSQIKPGTRAPVLQYAHPELGVQPAKIVKNEQRKRDDSPNGSNYQTQSHNSNHQSQQQQQSQPTYRHKKKYILNDKNVVDASYNYKNYYPNHFYGVKQYVYEPPFWMKVTQNIKSGISDGVAKVSELTKPVFDPLMEATRKISENLGLSRSSNSQTHAQDKISTEVAAAGSSVLIPALGLVASGAALGIGAVAVGRYLDVDVLKRSNEQNRALQLNGQELPEVLGEHQVFVVLPEETEAQIRQKRSSEQSIDGFESSKRAQRKGADPIPEIVEIDEPHKLLDGATNEDSNRIQEKAEERMARDIVAKVLESLIGEPKSKKNLKKLSENEAMSRSRRRRRSLIEDEQDDALQNLQNSDVAGASNGHISGNWANTSCSKRRFCDVMLERGPDAYMNMMKKMSNVLGMIHPKAVTQVSVHFDDVMDAVKRQDCSLFTCF